MVLIKRRTQPERMRKATRMTNGTSPGDLSYVESVSPGHGYAAARASGAKGSIQPLATPVAVVPGGFVRET